MTTLPGTLTGLADRELVAWLAEVRRVATLPDAEALAGLDTLLWSVMQLQTTRAIVAATHDRRPPGRPDDPVDAAQEAVWDQRLLDEQAGGLTAAIDRLDALAQYPETMKGWEPEQLREHTSRAHGLDPDLLAVARDTADRAEVRYLSWRLATLAAEPLASAASIVKRVTQVDTVAGGLERLGALTPALVATAREAKMAAAEYRANRKLADAEVAEAGDNWKKGHRLRAEARVCLVQDWARALPGEPLPTS